MRRCDLSANLTQGKAEQETAYFRQDAYGVALLGTSAATPAVPRALNLAQASVRRALLGQTILPPIVTSLVTEVMT